MYYHGSLFCRHSTVVEHDNGRGQPANIETVVLIQGKNAASMTDEQIFTFIRTLEDKVENYRAIMNDIEALVSYVDGR